MICDLALRQYSAVLPTAEILASKISQPQHHLDRVFALLVPPAVSLVEAAQIASEVLLVAAGAAIVIRPLAELSRSLLKALAKSWPMAYVAVAVFRAAADRLMLLPDD